MCIIFHSKKKKRSLKNVMVCVFESVRPFKKHSEVLTNPKECKGWWICWVLAQFFFFF